MTAADVRDAAHRIRPLAKHTPVMTSAGFNREAGTSAYFKCENFQTGGAFKIRGASNLILSLSKETLAHGVVTFSSGNHATAVAIASHYVGTQATIVMPEDAPRSKMETTRAYGAKVVTHDRLHESRESIANKICQETGALMVPPFDHPMIMAGAGTTGLELLEEVPDLDAMITPVGGGGLLSGSAIIAKEINPKIRMFGVEPEGADDTFRSVIAGHIISIPPPTTIADGLRSTHSGELTFPVIQKLVERIIVVTDDELRATVKFLLTRLKILVEPSGAAAAAAVLFHKLPAGIGKVGVVLSGGNVDFEQLAGL